MTTTTNSNEAKPVLQLPLWLCESRAFRRIFRRRLLDKSFCDRWGVPWISIFDVDTRGGGIWGFGVDWNSALVRKLRRAGYAGPDAETIVRDWVIARMKETEAAEIEASRRGNAGPARR